MMSNPEYNRDLQVYFNVMDQLNNVVMSLNKREVLEVSKEAIEIALNMYEIDYR